MNNQVKEMVSTIVDWYAESVDGLLTLEPKNIPESDLNTLAALMLSQDDDLAAEASGPDNPEFYTVIMPAMIRALSTPKNGFENEEFRDVQISAIRNYLMTRICTLIDEALEERNEDRVCHTSLIWDRVNERTVEVRI